MYFKTTINDIETFNPLFEQFEKKNAHQVRQTVHSINLSTKKPKLMLPRDSIPITKLRKNPFEVHPTVNPENPIYISFSDYGNGRKPVYSRGIGYWSLVDKIDAPFLGLRIVLILEAKYL